jgi:phage terminase large subunit-like protein
MPRGSGIHVGLRKQAPHDVFVGVGVLSTRVERIELGIVLTTPLKVSNRCTGRLFKA